MDLVELMLDKGIDASEYKEIKYEYEEEIGKLERQMEGISTMDSDLLEQFNFCCDLVEKLPIYFKGADLQAKQQILGSILAEKLVFDDNSYRTIPFRKVIDRICRPGKGFSGPENKESSENSELSTVVPRTGTVRF